MDGFQERTVGLADGGTVLDVAPGRHRIVSSDPAYVVEPGFVDVAADSAPSVALRWRRSPR